jgi:hypothetical protein
MLPRRSIAATGIWAVCRGSHGKSQWRRYGDLFLAVQHSDGSSEERTVFLHVGMHKTATTYIQNRLRKNRTLLARHGVLYPPFRRDHLSLVRAVEQQDPTPWLEWLGQASRGRRHLLVSAEALSLVMAQPVEPGGAMSLGEWLCRLLGENGWRTRVMVFVRDQPSYLNSRYTQLVKRLHTTSSFRDYARRVAKGNTESECDLMALFGWLFLQSEQEAGFDFSVFPFGGFLPSDNKEIRTGRPDPFEQVLAQLPMPRELNFAPVTAAATNQQPGQLGVRLARRLGRYLEKHYPELLTKNGSQLKVRARAQIERWAIKKGWHKEPFNGLTPAVWREIRDRYADSNAEFAQRVWGEGLAWADIFGDGHPQAPAQVEGAQRTAKLKTLKPLMEQLLRDLTPPAAR